MRLSHVGTVLIAASLATVFPADATAQGLDRDRETRLRPGDAVRVEIKDEPALSGEFLVGENGVALLPLVGLVPVGDRPFREVRDELLSAYAVQLVDPVIRITPVRRIAVLGEVRRPGLFPVDPTYTVSDLLAAAGGLTPHADRGKISVVREGEVVIARLDPNSASLRALLRSGDQIIVGRRSWLSENTPFVVGAIGSMAAAAIAALIVR